jgi:hypothetical protein
MTEARAEAPKVLPSRSLDLQIDRSKTNVRRFALLAIPLALLLTVFKVYSLEQPAFFWLSCLAFGGFAVSYWLPFQFKEPFLIALSLGGAFVLLSPQTASWLIVLGLAMFGVLRTGLQFRWKILAVLAVFAACAYGRASGRLPLPKELWAVFGAVFMFRMIVYMYDLKYARGPASLKDYLSYFFILPNYYFMLFPVVDFHTFRKSWLKRDIHTIAEQGVWRILRGTTQLLLYRIIYQMQGGITPPRVPVAAAIAIKIVCSYLLYLRISGQFHIITGMLCLFGYDMPETNRRYLLANSLVDFWRRINIYWKEFMVKVFYFPAYFRLRRQGELRAQVLATILVFVVTWFLHAYQFFWLQGKFHVSDNDSLFWIVLGILVVSNVWFSAIHKSKPKGTGWAPRIQNALQIAATFTVVSILWSMWSASSLTDWLEFLKTGTI